MDERRKLALLITASIPRSTQALPVRTAVSSYQRRLPQSLSVRLAHRIWKKLTGSGKAAIAIGLITYYHAGWRTHGSL
jgi:hypothetical protein